MIQWVKAWLSDLCSSQYQIRSFGGIQLAAKPIWKVQDTSLILLAPDNVLS